jgi:hypothetical protein
MKKILFFALIACAFCFNNAKAQGSDSTVTITRTLYISEGVNNLDTFSYYITADGWLNYTLIDNGPGSDPANFDYESNLYIVRDFHTTIFFEDKFGGGNISGSIYVGTTDFNLTVIHNCGWILGDHDLCEADGQDLYVSFGNE